MSHNISKTIVIINLYYSAELVRWFAWFFSQVFWGESIIFCTRFLVRSNKYSKAFCPGMLSCDHLFGQIRKTSIWYQQGDLHPFSQVHCSPKKETLIYKHLLCTAVLPSTFLWDRIVVESEKYPFCLKLTCLTLVAKTGTIQGWDGRIQCLHVDAGRDVCFVKCPEKMCCSSVFNRKSIII